MGVDIETYRCRIGTNSPRGMKHQNQQHDGLNSNINLIFVITIIAVFLFLLVSTQVTQYLAAFQNQINSYSHSRQSCVYENCLDLYKHVKHNCDPGGDTIIKHFYELTATNCEWRELEPHHQIQLVPNAEASSCGDAVQTSDVVNMLLLRAGIESNPGPGPNYQHLLDPGSDKVKYHNGLLRLSTFGAASQQFPSFSTSRLSQNGFYATGSPGQIKCFSCGFIYNVSEQSDPIVLHNQVAGCDHLRQIGAGGVVAASASNVIQVQQQPIYQSDCAVEQTLPKETLTENNPNVLRPALTADANAYMMNMQTYSSNVNGAGSLARSEANLRVGGAHANTVRKRIGYTDHRLEICRLETYRQWPSNAAVRPDDLANSGFFYLGTDDRVQCAFCRGILRNWEPNDKPLAEHIRHFPQCLFLGDPDAAGNIRLGEENDSIFSNVELRESEAGQTQPFFTNGSATGIITDIPSSQRYSMPAERLATYKDFPSNSFQTPEQLTRAGFFYTHHTDAVKCFFCDVTVRNWRPNDDPWVAHAKWSSRCGYVRMCKGEDFINDVLANKTTVSNETRRYRPKKKKAVKKFDVGPAQLDSAMRSALVQSILDMDFSLDVVRKVVKKRLEELGDAFPNLESLLDECNEFEDFSSSDSEMDTDDTAVPTPAETPTQTQTNPTDTQEQLNPESSVLNSATGNTYTEDEAALMDETEKLKEERQCKVCLDETACIVFLKCGHLVCCSNCAPAMRNCPVCRNVILGTIKVDV